MRNLRKVNLASAAVMNRQLIVHLLREKGPLSRRQLAQRSGLRSSSLTYITRELIARDVVRTFGKAEKTGVGKKQVLLEVNPDLGWVVGIGIDSDSASMVITDAQGRPIDRDRMAIREPARLLPQTLRARLDSWLGRHGSPPGKLLSAGVGIPGVVDPDRGVVLRSTTFDVENWPIGGELEETLGCPVTIDNDSNFAALAESRDGSAQGLGDFLYYLVNSRERKDRYAITGLGSSLFLNGQLIRGAHFGAGEIDALLEDEPYDSVSADQLLAIAAPEGEFNGDLHRLADRLTSTIVAIADLIDPAAVVLGGNLGIANRAMIDYIEEQLNARLVSVPRRHVAVRPSKFMDHGVSMGAAVAALDLGLVAQEPESPETVEAGVAS